MPKFSVIIPSYNRCAYLKATLESVWQQTFDDYEVIVVDDGSTDETPLYLAQLGERVRLIRQKNLGPGAARNKGAENARGEYLAFLDSDDLWFPWTLETVAELIEAHHQPALVAAKLAPFKDPAELEGINKTAATAEVFTDFLASSKRDFFVGANMTFVRREKFFAVSGFTSRQINLEDHDFILRLGAAEGFVQIVAPPTLGWRRHSASISEQFKRSFAGCNYLVESERRGVYPGGRTRSFARRRIITRHIRPLVLTFARLGESQLAWSLYKSTFIWNLGLLRFRYLLGFWPMFINPLSSLIRLAEALNSRRRNLWFALLGVRFGGYVWLRRISIPRQWSNISLSREVSLDDGVVLLCSGAPKENKISIGAGTYINRYTMLDAHLEINVGRNCMIGPHCYITDANHGRAAGALVKEQKMEAAPVVIEDDVWLGAGVVVLPGVCLGRGCVIGAGAVVTHDVPAGAVYAGVPAAEIGKRSAKSPLFFVGTAAG